MSSVAIRVFLVCFASIGIAIAGFNASHRAAVQCATATQARIAAIDEAGK